MILGETERGQVTVLTEKKIKRDRNTRGGVVYIITEPEEKLYRISFFKMR